MNDVSLGSSIAIRVDANTVALGVVSCVHDDGAADGLMYIPGTAPTAFSGLQVGKAESDVIGSGWFPATDLT